MSLRVISLVSLFLLSSTFVSVYSKMTSPYELERLYNSRRYKKVAKLLDVIPEFITPGENDPVTFENMGDKGIEQFDILLSSRQQKTRKRNPQYSIDPGMTWEAKEIPYAILESTFNSSNVLNIIKSAVERFNNEVPSVRFSEWKPSNDDCVVFYNGNRRFSNLGRIGGLQSISVPIKDDIFIGRVMHLMMHTLGFSHEIVRPDRDKYISILYDAIPKEIQPAFSRENPQTSKRVGPYDYYSIMHLPQNIFGINVYKVLQPNIDMANVGKTAGLTDVDKYKLGKVYPL